MQPRGFSAMFYASHTINYSAHLSTVGDKKYNIASGTTKFTAISHDDFMQPGEPNDLAKLKQKLTEIVDLFDQAILISINDPALLHMLQPKTGHSHQEWLTEVVEQMEKAEWGSHEYYRGYLIGREVPPSTINGLKIFITKNEPTIEFLAGYVLTLMKANGFNIDAVEVERGDYAVVLGKAEETLI